MTGRVVERDPPRRAIIEWHPAEWRPDVVTQIELQVEALKGGSRLLLEHNGWEVLLSDPRERIGWFTTEMAAPLLQASTSQSFGDWLTDRPFTKPSAADAGPRVWIIAPR
jgi:hypothetical protein